MSIPAGQTRRSRIQWHDDGSPRRARSFFPEDASPFRALGLAALLGAVSIAAVVSVIQFQRHGGFDEVSTSLVEEAQAGVQPQLADAQPSVQPAPQTAAVEAVPAEASTETSGVEAEKATGAIATADADATVFASNAALEKVEAIRSDELEQEALEPLTTSDPRWQAARTASIGAPLSTAPAEAKPSDLPLAFAPAEAPPPTARPEPATRKKASAEPEADAEPQLVSDSVADTASAKVRSSVFLRSRPADGSKVLVTIPGGASVQVATGCRHWCAVTYQGWRGFVYKSFLRR